MNKEEILAMEAGIKLNRLVAEKVMGLIAWEEKRGEYLHVIFQKPEDREPYRRSKYWEKEMVRYKRIEYSEINDFNHVVGALPEYSTDISAAWDVVIKMKIAIYPQSEGAPKDLKYLTEIYLLKPFKEKVEVFAKTATLAICKVALLAVIDP